MLAADAYLAANEMAMAAIYINELYIDAGKPEVLPNNASAQDILNTIKSEMTPVSIRLKILNAMWDGMTPSVLREISD